MEVCGVKGKLANGLSICGHIGYFCLYKLVAGDGVAESDSVLGIL